MSKIVNENISKTQKGIEEDKEVIKTTIAVLSEFEKGDLSQRINISCENPALNELTNILNNMGTNMEKNINGVLHILDEYSNYNYLNKVDTQGITEHLSKLANGVNLLGEAITSMLVENKKMD
jgi:methyl-accepting chemotaxis protein